MSMSMNVKDYVKIYDDFVDKSLCETIVDQLKEADWRTHEFYQANKDSYISFDKELSVSYVQTKETTELQSRVWFALEKYVLKDFGYMNDWFSGWSGYSQVRFNRYNVDTRMKEHCDHIHSMFDGSRKGIPTLSVLGALNDDYEGADLIFWNSEKIELKAGQIMLFPSNFMYPHTVTTLTKGTRYSYVSWVW
jgi:predicted 2-oxoglutarate/Fe(II)-dependent dioxygenase YbiX